MDGRSERPKELAGLLAELRGANNGGGLVLLRLRERLKAQASRSLSPGSLLRARLDSDDLAQEALAHLVQVVDRFQGTTWPEFLAFVRRVMDQCKVDLARHHGRDKRRSMDGMDPVEPTDSRSPSRTAMSREAHQQLLAAIDGLAEPYRSVVRLRLQEEDYASIARVLDISKANARQRFARGLELLRETLGAEHVCREPTP